MPRALPFPKSRRLTRSSEFERVRKEGRAWPGTAIRLAVVKDIADAKMRVGIITSRKVGGAVVRNRVRRRLREIVRRHQHRVNPGIWMVVIALARAAHASSSALEDEWLRLARRASILAP